MNEKYAKNQIKKKDNLICFYLRKKGEAEWEDGVGVCGRQLLPVNSNRNPIN